MSSKMNWDELIGPTLLDGKDEEVPTSGALRGKKFVMLYFSAHWCPPCLKFTPTLAAAYRAHGECLLRRDGDGNVNGNHDEKDNDDVDDDDGEIEVVFVSLDSVKSEYDNYRHAMPWPSVPFANLHKLRIKDDLSTRYAMRGIPALIVLDGNSGEVVTTNGRGRYGEFFMGGSSSVSSSCIALLKEIDILENNDSDFAQKKNMTYGEVAAQLGSTMTIDKVNTEMSPYVGDLEGVNTKAKRSHSSKKVKGGDTSHYNLSRKYIFHEKKMFKCNRAAFDKDSNTYTKYFSCEMALDTSDGSKWKPFNEIGKFSGKKNTMDKSNIKKCGGTMIGVFGMLGGKETKYYRAGAKAHICHIATYVEDGRDDRKKARTTDPPTPLVDSAPITLAAAPTLPLTSTDDEGSPKVRVSIKIDHKDLNLYSPTPQESVTPKVTTQKDKVDSEVVSNNIEEKLKLAKQFHDMVNALFGNKLAAARACPEFKIFLEPQELSELDSEERRLGARRVRDAMI